MNFAHPSGSDRKASPQADAGIPQGDPPPTVPPSGTSAAQDGRDKRGRFTPGNKGGPGNPFTRKTAALRQAMLDAVTEDDLQTVIRQLIQKARAGDVSAARLVLIYTIGKPDKAVDPDTVELQEWNLYQQSRIASEDFLGVIGGLQAPLASSIARAALPSIQETTAQNLHQMLVDSLVDPGSSAAAAPQAQDASASVSEPVVQHEVPAPPPPKPAGQPKPARAKRERVARPGAVSPPPAAGFPEALDLRGDEEHWLAFLQEVLRQSRGAEGHTMSGENPPPIANGLLRSPGQQ